jgi:hypothetical protein
LVYTATTRTRLLPFGAPASELESALTRVWGPWREGSRRSDCGAEPPTLLSWSNGVTVLLEDDVFAGWTAARPRADGAPLPAVQSMAGLGVGTERTEVEEAYVLQVRETTLGTAFEAGGISGVLEDASAAAEVTSLWAGRACLFR